MTRRSRALGLLSGALVALLALPPRLAAARPASASDKSPVLGVVVFPLDDSEVARDAAAHVQLQAEQVAQGLGRYRVRSLAALLDSSGASDRAAAA